MNVFFLTLSSPQWRRANRHAHSPRTPTDVHTSSLHARLQVGTSGGRGYLHSGWGGSVGRSAIQVKVFLPELRKLMEISQGKKAGCDRSRPEARVSVCAKTQRKRTDGTFRICECTQEPGK